MKVKPFQAGRPLVPQLSAAHLNAIREELKALQPLPGKGTKLRKYRNGFSYSAEPGSKAQTIKLGFTVRRKTSSSVTVSPAVVSGCSVVAVMPKIDGTRLDDETPPQLAITPEAVQYICLKMEIYPDASKNADGETYSLRDGAGILVGDITVLAFDSEQAMESESQRAKVDGETGEPTQNGIFLVPLAKVLETGAVNNEGYYYGPIGIKLCAAGTLQIQAPVIAVTSLE